MNVTLTHEQEQIKNSFAEFLDSQGGIEAARTVMDGDDAERERTIDELWADLTDLDYTSLTVPIDYDGFGEGMVYLSVVLEEAGKVAMPGPFPETVAFVTPIVEELGTQSQKSEYFAAINDGEQFTMALYDTEHPLPESIQLRAERRGDEFVLNGTKRLVPYGGMADRILVATRTQRKPGFQEISLFVVDAADLTARRVDSLDRVRPMYDLEFDDVTVPETSLVGPLHGGGDVLSTGMDRYTIAMCAMLVGAADETVQGSVEHATEREQYGNPVGMYQSVKHRIVDMWVATQCARSLVYYAAWASDEDASDAPRAVSAAKSFVAEDILQVFEDDVKNHGGMGFTWEHDAHVFLKQAKAWQRFIGSPEYHRERIADADFETVDY